MSFYTRFRLLNLALLAGLLLAGLTQLRTVPAAAAISLAATTATPVAPTARDAVVVVVRANANIRSGPGTTYPVIGGARAGQRLPVLGGAKGWWQVTLGGGAGWIWGGLATANAAARPAPEITTFPPAPPKQAAPAVTSTPQPAALPDLVVLGPDTHYPVRARVIQGWGYEFVDLSRQYDIVVYRDVFGMLAHQIDDENVRRFGRQSRFARSGPIRITLVDAQPHPDPACPGWGWTPDRDTAVDPYGLNEDPCRVEHSLFPRVTARARRCSSAGATTPARRWRSARPGRSWAMRPRASSRRRCRGRATSARRTDQTSANRCTRHWGWRTRRMAAGSGRTRLSRPCPCSPDRRTAGDHRSERRIS